MYMKRVKNIEILTLCECVEKWSIIIIIWLCLELSWLFYDPWRICVDAAFFGMSCF